MNTSRAAILPGHATKADVIYWLGGAALCAFIACQLAARFEPLPVMGRCGAAGAFLIVALGLTWARGRINPVSERAVFYGTVLMLLASSLACSVLRKEVVVVVWPALFVVPGALFGLALAQPVVSGQICENRSSIAAQRLEESHL